jgi:carboxylesterase
MFAASARSRVIRHFERDASARRPVGADGIVIGAEGFTLEGSATHAVLLLHGFGDTPQSVRPLAVTLQAAGWTVRAELLAGHGRPLREYAKVRERDWVDGVSAAYTRLCSQYQTVVVCGLSMGAALAVILAEAHPEIPSLALLAPYLVMPRDMHVKTDLARLLNYIYPYHANTGGETSIHDPIARAETLGVGVVTAPLLSELRAVALHAQRALPSLRARTLYLQSREDNRINADDAVRQFARLGSPIKEQRWLTGCGHIITVDYCKDEVARQVVEWFAPDLGQGASALRLNH